MIKERLKIVQQNFEDLRFGEVNIYSLSDSNGLVMEKVLKTQSPEEFQSIKNSTVLRMQLNSPNILPLLDYSFDDSNMNIHQFFNYPNEDLIERKQALQNPKEFLSLLKGIIQALATLEKFNIVHGNIKPEYIYFDGEKYILLDRLADNSSPNEAQIQNLQSNEFIYLPPNVFEELMKGNTFFKHNYFKTDLFCLGMVVISQLLQEEEQLQAVYDKETSAFSSEKFRLIITHLKRNLFSEGDLKKVGDLLFYGILNPNQQ